MPTTRSYRDSCAVARALDVVGERWALLVVRELLFAPRRFSELRQALPNASSNLLADRLRELEARDVVRRRRHPEPAGPQVYELTERGRALEPVILALSDWGMDVPQPSEPTSLSATSALIFVRDHLRGLAPTSSLVCRLELDGSVWTLHVSGGEVEVSGGEPDRADVSLRTDPRTLGRLVSDPAALDEALAEGSVALVGDPGPLRRLLGG